ncbi:MAG: hypothetical protein KJ587_14275 [Alphaproteobacteria bacterium]|nr:hypothetical protein [Alphaproteobacteria bacterium]
MIDTLKTSALVTLLFTALVTFVFLATPSYAGPLTGAQTAGAIQSTGTLAPMTVAGRKGPSGLTGSGGAKKPCNGSTTSECCKGLSYCSCLYMPGSSSDNHPTACFKGSKPRG